MARKSTANSQYSFAQAPTVDVPRSSFDRSHGHKTTFNASNLYPIYFDEVLPGDTHAVTPYVFARLATPIAPFMDNVRIDYHFFFVPYRLVWSNFKKFMGEKEFNDDTIFYLPTITAPAGGFAEESLFDYFGLPTKVAGIEVQALPIRAYNLIWSEWYRDQNTQNSAVQQTDDGPDDPLQYVLLKRNKRHDYFTGALKDAQKGDPVTLPIGGFAPVTDFGQATVSVGGGTSVPLNASDGYSLDGSRNALHAGNNQDSVGGTNQGVSFTNLQADLSAATAATVNSIRLAFQTQRFLERDARSGTRYTETLRAHFGVTSEDSRLQRPELLSSGSVGLNVSPVPQTSETTGSSQTPQGNLAAYGTVTGRPGSFTKSFTEHGVIIGLMSARADLSYQEGVHRSWRRSTKFDFAWPVFSHIGEQAIENIEIQAKGDGSDSDPWAFQERYAEYRYKPSQITGKFRSNATQSLEYWHLSEYFGATFPNFNGDFLVDKSPIERVIAVQDEPEFIADMHFQVKSTRPLPVYSVPGLIDHL